MEVRHRTRIRNERRNARASATVVALESAARCLMAGTRVSPLTVTPLRAPKLMPTTKCNIMNLKARALPAETLQCWRFTFGKVRCNDAVALCKICCVA
jgi:hypothetical protein